MLVGQPPEGFSLPYHPLDINPPRIPPGLPSELLERRPDVAAAERRVAAQNAEIGVAISAYFPVVRLTGETGFDSGDLGLLFNWESRIWSYGPSIQFPIFEGGRIAANIKQERATYEENVADYRQQVLIAFQDVEDSLSALKYLSVQYEAENRAYLAYQRALDLTNARLQHRAGLLLRRHPGRGPRPQRAAAYRADRRQPDGQHRAADQGAGRRLGGFVHHQAGPRQPRGRAFSPPDRARSASLPDGAAGRRSGRGTLSGPPRMKKARWPRI